MQRRHLVLGIVLALSVGASIWLVVNDEPGVSLPASRGASASPSSSASSAPRAGGAPRARTARSAAPEEKLVIPGGDALRRQAFHVAGDNLFAARDWQPPPPPRAPPPIVTPTAPPLPFRFLGQLLDGQQTVVFLGAGTRTLMARVGDTLDGQYRVDSVGAGNIVFVYQPLNERQSLPIGKTQ